MKRENINENPYVKNELKGMEAEKEKKSPLEERVRFSSGSSGQLQLCQHKLLKQHVK